MTRQRFEIISNGCLPTVPQYLQFFPLVVWVEVPPVPREDYRSGKCNARMIYRVCPASAKKVIKQMGWKGLDPERIFVCPHMGKLLAPMDRAERIGRRKRA